MKRTAPKRLVLNRQTITQLTPDRLRAAGAGNGDGALPWNTMCSGGDQYDSASFVSRKVTTVNYPCDE